MLAPAKNIPCPDCYHMVDFNLKVPSMVVCHSCSVVISRQDAGLEVKPKIKIVPEDMTILKIGTLGFFNKQKFELVGRIRYTSAMKYVNFWTVSFEDKSYGLLTESYGTYGIYLPDNSSSKIYNSALKKEQVLTDGNHRKYCLDEVLTIISVSGEGEFPEAWLGTQLPEIIEYSNNAMEVYLFLKKGESLQQYSGIVSSFEKLSLKQTRNHHGWI